MNALEPRKVVLVTGAAKRIGAAIATHFHERGYDVVVHCHQSLPQASQLVASFNARRADSAHCLQADLCDMDAVQTLANDALAWRGKVDVLINNASRFYPTALGNIDARVWDDLVGSNLKGAFFLAQALAPSLQAHAGSIINISDIHAQGALHHYPVYSIAKAGVQMMTKALARELAPHVRVNGIAPGAILWPEHAPSDPSALAAQQTLLSMIALQRLGSPEDIAATAWFFAEEARYCTGQTIRVDGGRTQGNSLLS